MCEISDMSKNPRVYLSLSHRVPWEKSSHLFDGKIIPEYCRQMDSPPQKSTVENPPFEDVFPIETEIFRMSLPCFFPLFFYINGGTHLHLRVRKVPSWRIVTPPPATEINAKQKLVFSQFHQANFGRGTYGK